MKTSQLIQRLQEIQEIIEKSIKHAETLQTKQPLVMDHEDLMIMHKTSKQMRTAVWDLEEIV